jgi:hypothetical protein
MVRVPVTIRVSVPVSAAVSVAAASAAKAELAIAMQTAMVEIPTRKSIFDPTFIFTPMFLSILHVFSLPL